MTPQEIRDLMEQLEADQRELEIYRTARMTVRADGLVALDCKVAEVLAAAQLGGKARNAPAFYRLEVPGAKLVELHVQLVRP